MLHELMAYGKPNTFEFKCVHQMCLPGFIFFIFPYSLFAAEISLNLILSVKILLFENSNKFKFVYSN